MHPKKLTRLAPEKAARIICEQYLGLEKGDPKIVEAATQLAPIIAQMRQIGGSVSDWEQALNDAMILARPN
jgi:hypothetical protein